MSNHVYQVIFLFLLSCVSSGASLKAAISVTNKMSQPVDVVLSYPQWMNSRITQVYPNKSSNITDVNKFAKVQVIDDYQQTIAEAWYNPADKTAITMNGAITIFEKDGKVQIKIQ